MRLTAFAQRELREGFSTPCRGWIIGVTSGYPVWVVRWDRWITFRGQAAREYPMHVSFIAALGCQRRERQR